jgi:hypothetical protein
MYETPPNSQNAGTFGKIEEIFYGSDDGFADASFKEIQAFENFHNSVAPRRRQRIHLMTVVGGFYGLNLIPLLRPREITLFDINPHQITYSKMIIRVLTASRNAEEFMRRLTNQDYEARSIEEEFIRESIAMKQTGALPRSRGRSKRSLADSWKYALDRFDLTKQVLSEANVETNVGGMQEDSFQDRVYSRPDLWIYPSNIFLFVFFKLRFLYPANAAMLALYHHEPEFLDLGRFDDGPVELQCRIPMSASPIDNAGLSEI